MDNFIKYLNSMNSAKIGSMNALAESQVISEYYSRIFVKRNIAEKIYNLLTEKNEAIILTGHAGDGKTSILIQVLDRLGYFTHGKKPLREEELFENLYYVKDMSELNPALQKKLLLKLLNAPHEAKSSIIVSNTGPLINTFNDLFEESTESESLEKRILQGIGDVISEPIQFVLDGKAYRFRLVNIANIDNSYLVREILRKLTDQSLWGECKECKNAFKCPIYNNYLDVIANIEGLNEQITLLYYWLSEKGTRLTIRQLVAHITYSLTSNLDCEEVDGFSGVPDNLFKYSFANSFFGFRGLESYEDAKNIKTVNELRNVSLDEKTLGKIDIQLFVKEDLSKFSENIQMVLLDMINKNPDAIGDFDSDATRRALRRYFILFNNETIEKRKALNEVLISEAIVGYYHAATKTILDIQYKRKIEKTIFTALFRLFLGVFPKKNEESLYITLRKDFHLIQNTQMLIGKIPKSDLKINLKPRKNLIEPELIKSELFLEFGNSEFRISAEFLDFLFKFSEGEVFTDLNPSFTFGLSRLKSNLLKEYKFKDESINLMIVQKNMLHKIKVKVEDSKIYVD